MVVQPLNLVLLLAISSHLMTLGSAGHELVINVHASGTDQSSCLMSNSAEPCKSLWFILGTLTGHNSSQRISAETILINVASDQVILDGELQYYLDYSVNVTVSGIGRPSILCENRSSLTISTNKAVQVEWVWKEIAFYGCGFMEFSQTKPGLLHKFFHSIQILNCSMVMQAQIQLDEIYQVIISNTEFVQDHSECIFPAILAINNTCLSISQSKFEFSNNSIMDYSCHGLEEDELRGFLDIVSCFDIVLFADNNFSNISLTPQSPGPDQSPPHPLYGLILFRSSDFRYIIATSVHVNNNNFTFIHADFVMVTPHLADQCEFEINNFLYITSQFELLNVSFCQELYLHQNQFIENNIKDGLIEIVVAMNDIILDELTLVDNDCVFNLLSLDVFSDPRNVSIQHVHAKMNRISDSTNFIGSHQVFVFILTARELIMMKNITFIDNHILIGQCTENSALVLIDCDNCTSSVADASFLSNAGGTPLSINGNATKLQARLLVQLSGTLLFFNNTALYGGAFSFSYAAVEFFGDVNLNLSENSADYGGAMYLNSTHFEKCDSGTLNVQNNTAKKQLYSENFMYFAEISSGHGISQCPLFRNYTDSTSITSVVSNFSFLAGSNSDDLPIIPGQKIKFNVSISDFFGHSSSCKANVSLLCNGSNIDCESRIITKFNESTEIVTISQNISSNKTTVETGLVILLSKGNISNISASLELACQLPSAAGVPASCHVPLKIKDCPLGFVPLRRVCKCCKISNNVTKFPCSIDDRAACVPKGFWYGMVHNTSDNTTVYVFARCSFPECKHTHDSCNVTSLSEEERPKFVRLEGTCWDGDDQCSFGRGGVLCRGCKPGFVFTFTAVKCISSSKCDNVAHPIIAISVSLMFQVIFAVVLFFVVRFKLPSGSGFLYGPMLFLSIIGNLQLNQYPAYETLNTIISVLSSIPLLNLEVFGLIPWCFPFDKVYNYSLRYLGPLTVLMVILAITLIARWCPKALQCCKVSPSIRPMCILMILSFWSLADTSVHILTPTFIKGIKTPFVSLQPEHQYFSSPHRLVAIPAILVLVVLITPLLFLLLFFPLLSKVVNLHRIKPFLDEFHSCYKDPFRWYSAVYFIAWIIIVIVERLSQVEDIGSEYLEAAIICIYGLLMFGQVFIWPYQSKLLNMADIFLLVDIFILRLVCLLWLSEDDTIENSTGIKIICVYILVIGPILFITVWFSCALISKCGLYMYMYEYFRNKQCIKRRQSAAGGDENCNMQQHQDQPTAPEPRVYRVRYITDPEDREREPLITIMDYR